MSSTTPQPPRPTRRHPTKPGDRNPLTYHMIRVCPECAGPVVRNSGCIVCLQCGWGRCQ